ncbi:MAG: DUF1848 domain-containing protein [Rikenellaceae bacterium]|nr:DUF1848 domain-containing protein [Rikenellaceae bacterium]
MILSVSRRTDIPAFYPDWFYNRLKDGYVCVRNPMNYRSVSRIALDPDTTDCIVFWTKNPAPMLARIEELTDYKYYFQVTVNPYGTGIERSVPDIESVTASMRQLASLVGRNRVVWRYDPIFYTQGFGYDEHKKYFTDIAQRLSGCVERCVIGYLHLYGKTVKNVQGTGTVPLTSEEIIRISINFRDIARRYGIDVLSCSETVGLEGHGVGKASCIDPILISDICGYPVNVKKDKNQRAVCRCVESIDIGEYSSCPHGCLYCYANKTPAEADRKYGLHDPESPLLLGNITEEDTVKDRKIASFRTNTLF